MIIEYKKEIHIDDTDTKNNSMFSKNRISFRNVNPDEPMGVSCCKPMEISRGYGFIQIKHDNIDRVDLKYEERQKPAESPLMCLFTIEPGEHFEDNEEKWLPINKCPFCGGDITIECVQTKEIIHKCKKETKTEEVCTSYTEEKIIE